MVLCSVTPRNAHLGSEPEWLHSVQILCQLEPEPISRRRLEGLIALLSDYVLNQSGHVILLNRA